MLLNYNGLFNNTLYGLGYTASDDRKIIEK